MVSFYSSQLEQVQFRDDASICVLEEAFDAFLGVRDVSKDDSMDLRIGFLED